MRTITFDKARTRYYIIKCIHYGESGGHYVYLVLLSCLSHEVYRYGAIMMLVCSLLRHVVHGPDPVSDE